MKYKILGHFNPRINLINESQLRSMEYDVGELSKFIKKYLLTNVSEINPSPNTLFFNLKTATSTRKYKNSLIFIPDLSETTLTKIIKLKTSSANSFYYIDQTIGNFGEEIFNTLKDKSILPLNFIDLFRKSNFNDWEIVILYGLNLKLNNIVLNTFFALGAGIKKEEKKPKKMNFLKNIPLSFQHSIDLFQMK